MQRRNGRWLDGLTFANAEFRLTFANAEFGVSVSDTDRDERVTYSDGNDPSW